LERSKAQQLEAGRSSGVPDAIEVVSVTKLDMAAVALAVPQRDTVGAWPLSHLGGLSPPFLEF
jgi:hypothetical protein